MIYLVILVVMLVAFTAVGWPLVTNSSGTRRESRAVSALDDLVGQRDAAYRGIKELDFEYELGNLSESDYQRLRQRYRTEAAATLRSLDAAAGGGSEAPAGGPAASTGTAPSDSIQAERSCSSCGRPIEAGDRYCWSCGDQLGRQCANCGGLVQARHEFCGSCGTRLEAGA
jgi:RNA polymerase subunit RPABC4/transcription elongation factor Spt4